MAKSNRSLLFIALLLLTGQAAALDGQIKICRKLTVAEAMDGKSVDIPRDGTYAGKCNKNGERCRDIVVGLRSSGVIGPKKTDCAFLPASLLHADGAPLVRGEILLPQYSVPGFTPVVTVTETFR